MLQVATVSPDIEFSYIDSGVPEKNSENYVTVFMIHGYAWSGGKCLRVRARVIVLGNGS